MSEWTIPDGESASNSIWFGLEAIVSCIAPTMTATTTKLQLQASADPMSVDDDDADFYDVTVDGTEVKFSVSASAGVADGLETLVRQRRVRVNAETDAGASVNQSGAKVITPMSIRT